MKNYTGTAIKNSIFIAIIFLFFLSCATDNDEVGQFSNAKWISINKNQSDSNQWICFRKTFQIDEFPTNTIIANISVDSKYWLWINGQLVVFEG